MQNGDVSKLTMKEMEAIAFKSFNGAKLTGDKAPLISACGLYVVACKS